MPSEPFSFDPGRAALVLIDLQRGVVARPTEPRSPAEVIAASARLADALRPVGGDHPNIQELLRIEERAVLSHRDTPKPVEPGR